MGEPSFHPDAGAIAAVLTGVMIAIADGRHNDASALIRTLYASQMPEAIRQLAAFIVGLALAGGATIEEIRAELSVLALIHAGQ